MDLEERRDREGSVDSLPASVARVAHGFSEDTCWNWDWDKAISRVREIRRERSVKSAGDGSRGGEERLQQIVCCRSGSETGQDWIWKSLGRCEDLYLVYLLPWPECLVFYFSD